MATSSFPDNEELAPGVARLAQRLLTRDQPPPPPPLKFDRASVVARLAEGIGQQIKPLKTVSRQWLGEVLYLLLEQPTWSSRELARHFRRDETGVNRQMSRLAATGLVRKEAPPGDGRQRRYQLTRAGEDWVQRIVQVPLPEAPHVSSATEPAAPPHGG